MDTYGHFEGVKLGVEGVKKGSKTLESYELPIFTALRISAASFIDFMRRSV